MMQIVSGACYTLGVLLMLTAWTLASFKIYEARVESYIEHQTELSLWGPK